MLIKQVGNDVYVSEVKDFDLAQTLECGQCFRFYRIKKDEYIVVAHHIMQRVEQVDDTVIFYDCSIDTYEDIWKRYFDMERDYGLIKDYLLQYDDKLKEAIEEKAGVRILRQEFFENLISFIISQNKQIPHIKKIVNDIAMKYGDKVGTYDGVDYYSFPTPKQLSVATEEDFRELKTGFRAPYLVDAVEKVVNGEICEQELDKLSAIDAEKVLVQIKGVGNKVANCVMLFSLSKTDAFPIDVWVKRIMERVYYEGKDTKKEEILKFAKEHFGEYGGFAQQYLFYYARDSK